MTPRLDALIEHLWAFASIDSPDEFARWDSGIDAVSLIGYRTSLANEIATLVSSELRADFSSLVSDAQNLGMYDAYGADTDGPIDMLLNVFTLLENHNVPIPPLDAFTPSVHDSDWGMPVDVILMDSWRSLDYL